MTKSYLSLLMISAKQSATSCALISGCWSSTEGAQHTMDCVEADAQVATFGDGIIFLSSPLNCFSTPPLRKKVTCANRHKSSVSIKGLITSHISPFLHTTSVTSIKEAERTDQRYGTVTCSVLRATRQGRCPFSVSMSKAERFDFAFDKPAEEMPEGKGKRRYKMT